MDATRPGVFAQFGRARLGWMLPALAFALAVVLSVVQSVFGAMGSRDYSNLTGVVLLLVLSATSMVPLALFLAGLVVLGRFLCSTLGWIGELIGVAVGGLVGTLAYVGAWAALRGSPRGIEASDIALFEVGECLVFLVPMFILTIVHIRARRKVTPEAVQG